MAHNSQLLRLKGNEPEVEISTFERFETELKNTMFGMTFLMLKNEDDSFVKLYIIIFIQACQLFSLVFNPNISFPWKGHSVETGFEKVLQTFQIIYWIQYTNWSVYLIIFYCVFALVLLSIAIVGYSIYSISNKHMTIIWFLRILHYAESYFISVLFMPFLCIFIIILRYSSLFITM